MVCERFDGAAIYWFRKYPTKNKLKWKVCQRKNSLADSTLGTIRLDGLSWIQSDLIDWRIASHKSALEKVTIKLSEKFTQKVQNRLCLQQIAKADSSPTDDDHLRSNPSIKLSLVRNRLDTFGASKISAPRQLQSWHQMPPPALFWPISARTSFISFDWDDLRHYSMTYVMLGVSPPGCKGSASPPLQKLATVTSRNICKLSDSQSSRTGGSSMKLSGQIRNDLRGQMRTKRAP